MLEFRLLGPVEMSSAGVDYPIQGAIQQGLLVSLLVSADRTVSVDELRTELWGACWAGSSENALHAHVSRLRRQLKRAEPALTWPRLQSVRSGYRLTVDDERLRAELAVWRGPAFGGLVGGPICESGARELEQARQEAQALLFDAELRCGHHPRILAELRAEVEAYSPYLESFTERLMVALYRCGRQVEALQAYQRTVRCLASHAQSPSARLSKVHQAVLNQAPMLDGLMAPAL
jgi:DNA-binding SARP family transcriptional activator